MTHVPLPDNLNRQVELIVGPAPAAVHRFVTAAVDEALSRRLARGAEDVAEPVRVLPVGATGVLPDVDLTRWVAFLEAQAVRGVRAPRHRAVRRSA